MIEISSRISNLSQYSKTKMPERSSKRKARRDSPASSLDEPEAASQRTKNVASISDKDFSEISEKVAKSVSGRMKETETNQREILKMLENLSSKIDTLSGRTPGTMVSETNTSRLTDLMKGPELEVITRSNSRGEFPRVPNRN